MPSQLKRSVEPYRSNPNESIVQLSQPATAAMLENRNAPDIDDRYAMLQRIVLHCKSFQGSNIRRSVAQAALSLVLYALVVACMFLALAADKILVTALLVLPAAGLLVKLFTIQHDCGHGSYFEQKALNHALGFAVSMLTFTPYGFWRDAHNRHHASSGHLDKRGIGGVDTLTVAEFERLSVTNRVIYQFYRHPLVMFVIGAPLHFIVLQRFPISSPMPFAETYHGMKIKKIWRSVLALDVALVLFYGSLTAIFGLKAVAIVFLPTVAVASWIGAWLFFVQHQFEGAYWKRSGSWDYNEAAVFGSSHYDLPRILHWFSGNIGYHHIHHLCSLIPNYRLAECYKSSPDLRQLPRLTLRESLGCARLALWDETRGKMISFREQADG